ncbi:MAG TPA: PilN domain-containing protein [Candidatus Paceibacterota bacterium]|nr:PilN domain-containing protein [Candidatus Paceibacterota bacterium]
MFTFLPRSYRPEVEKEYRKRVFAVAFALGAVLMLSAAALAAPSYIILSAKRAAASLSATKTTAAGAEGNASLESRIRDIKAKIGVLKTVADSKSIVSVLDRLVGQITPGIILTGMTLKRSEGPGGILVSGSAATRDALVAFSKSLQGEPSFQNVALPVSSLAKSSNIGFSITIDSSF